MRRKYLKLWWDEVRRGSVLRWPLRLLGAAVSSGCARMLTGPISAEIMVTWRCSARCEMCDYPARASEPELSTDEIIRLIDELADLAVAGISLSGGEPFLRSDLFEIVRHVKKRGLMVQIATNGLLLAGRNAELLVESGVDMVTVSLDSPHPEIFASIRGVSGIYERVVSGIQYLASYRRQRGRGPGIIISTIITGRTLSDIPSLLELSRGLGADAVTLIPVQEVATIPNRLNGNDNQRLGELFRVLLERKKRGDRFLDNSAGYLKLMLERQSDRPRHLRCFIPYTDLHIGPQGEVFPCSYYAGMNRSWGNVRRASLKEMWYSRDYQKRRRRLLDCRKCSIPCHWEMNLLFHRLVFPRFL